VERLALRRGTGKRTILGIKRSDSVFFLPLLDGGYGARPRQRRGPFRDQQISTIRIPQRKLINSSGTISRLISLGCPLLCHRRMSAGRRESRKLIATNGCEIGGKLRAHFYFDLTSSLLLSLSLSLWEQWLPDVAIPRTISRPIDSRSTERQGNQCHFANVRFGYSFSAERVAADPLVLAARSPRSDGNAVSKSVRSNEFFAYRANTP